MSNMQSKNARFLLLLLVMTILVLLLAPLIGQRPSTAGGHTGGKLHLERTILLQVRLPRVCIAFLAGAALALSGMVFQAMFRNPLATPFTLGVSSGASLGAAMGMRLGVTITVLGIAAPSLFAFAGAGLAILLVYGLTLLKRGFPTGALLLAGVAVSLFFTSLILFVQYLSDFTGSFRVIRWLMGNMDVLGFGPVLGMLPFVGSGCLILLLMGRELDLMSLGDDIAISRGVNVPVVKKTLFFATSLMVGGVVAVCGPIGFVGMMVPHICRLIVGSNHRHLAPACVLFGGSFLVACDVLARTLIAPAQIPVGIVTALLGGPFFLWLLLGNALGYRGFLEGEK